MRSRLENRFPDDFSYLSRGFDGTCKILVELVFSVRRILNGQLSRFFPQTFYQTPYSFFLSWRIAVISYEYTRVRSYHTTRFGRKYPFWTELKVFFLRFFRFFFPYVWTSSARDPQASVSKLLTNFWRGEASSLVPTPPLTVNGNDAKDSTVTATEDTAINSDNSGSGGGGGDPVRGGDCTPLPRSKERRMTAPRTHVLTSSSQPVSSRE